MRATHNGLLNTRRSESHRAIADGPESTTELSIQQRSEGTVRQHGTPQVQPRTDDESGPISHAEMRALIGGIPPTAFAAVAAIFDRLYRADASLAKARDETDASS